MAVGDLDLAHIELSLIRPGDAEVGGVDVDTVRAEVGRKKTCCDDLVEELGWAVGSDRVQSSAEHVVVEVVPRDALAEEAFDGDVIEEVGKQVETTFDEPETVENHGLEHLRIPHSHTFRLPNLRGHVIFHFREDGEGIKNCPLFLPDLGDQILLPG